MPKLQTRVFCMLLAAQPLLGASDFTLAQVTFNPPPRTGPPPTIRLGVPLLEVPLSECIELWGLEGYATEMKVWVTNKCGTDYAADVQVQCGSGATVVLSSVQRHAVKPRGCTTMVFGACSTDDSPSVLISNQSPDAAARGEDQSCPTS